MAILGGEEGPVRCPRHDPPQRQAASPDPGGDADTRRALKAVTAADRPQLSTQPIIKSG
jgi:hypothetical protein